MDSCPSFGEWLRQRRKELDLTRAELAQCVGCSVSALRKIESDERRPSKQLAELLANCLGVPPSHKQHFVSLARGHLCIDKLGALQLSSKSTLDTASLYCVHCSKNPTPIGTLIGRDAELASLSCLLADTDCRLLTLVGPGGIGKTRLAIEAASRQASFFADGIHFVCFASISSNTFTVPAIARSLNLTFQGRVEPRIQLLNFLSTKQALIVLDNVEHLLDGVDLFAEIMEEAPSVKLLATSRERLCLQKEWVLRVVGFPTPPIEGFKAVQEYSAATLFLQTARRACVGFELQLEDWPALVRICQLVGGMPLGLELAATWVPLLSCDEIAREIERSLDFLTTAHRDVPERQRSLRAVFEQSWNLLSLDERCILCQIAVFRGGFCLDAVKQVAGATLPLLSRLVSKSLVRRTERGRYDLHPVIQQYALTHLAQDPEVEISVRDRHCDYYLTLLQTREKDLKSAKQQAIHDLTEEVDNVRDAWAWGIKQRKFSSLVPALRCFGLLYDILGMDREGIEQLDSL